MTELATSTQMKHIDRTCGIESRELMQNAAECLLSRIENLKNEYILPSRVTVVCGTGNNGGDGYALAILLCEGGYDVTLVAADRPTTSDALYYFALCADMEIPIISAEEELPLALETVKSSNFIVDALFGIGLSRAPEEPCDELICAVNAADAFVLSVDIPSGIYADNAGFHNENGVPLCVNADVTSTFVMKKPAHVAFPAAPYCGRVFVEDIGIPPEIVARENFALFVTDDEYAARLFPRRKINANKGDYGTLVSVCGSENMTGAAALAAEAAVRSGVGLVACAANRKTLNVLQNKLNFPIFLPLETSSDGVYTEKALAELVHFPKASAMLVGCGLGKSPASVQLVEYIVKNAAVPLVLDADALNIIAEKSDLLAELKVPPVLTPHPGEMARLCRCSVEYVQNNRIPLAQKFAREHRVTLLLKGAATVIAAPDGRTAINSTGTPAMAKGGMGDVLGGIVAALVAQGNPPFESAVVGAHIHGSAGEEGEKIHSQYGLSPDDMPRLVAGVIKREFAHNLY